MQHAESDAVWLGNDILDEQTLISALDKSKHLAIVMSGRRGVDRGGDASKVRLE